MIREKHTWVWGYTLQNIPERNVDYVGFVPNGCCCSLETAADYMRAHGVVYANTLQNLDNLTEDQFKYLKDIPEVIMCLTHWKYVESARKIAEFSLTHPNITGVLLDDFLEETGPTKDMTVEEFKEVYDTVKAINPKLKMWIVKYSRHNLAKFEPYLPYIDGISNWIWVSTEHYWRYCYYDDIFWLRQTGKEIMQGVFLQNFGEDFLEPTSMEMLELGMEKIHEQFQMGRLDSWIVLQNGFFNRLDHRKHLQFLKDANEWFWGTFTQREE